MRENWICSLKNERIKAQNVKGFESLATPWFVSYVWCFFKWKTGCRTRLFEHHFWEEKIEVQKVRIIQFVFCVPGWQNWWVTPLRTCWVVQSMTSTTPWTPTASPRTTTTVRHTCPNSHEQNDMKSCRCLRRVFIVNQSMNKSVFVALITFSRRLQKKKWCVREITELKLFQKQ